MKNLIIIALMLCMPSAAFARYDTAGEFAKQVKQLEQRFGGRLGVAAINTDNGMMLEYRADERFAFCSTYKLPLVAAVLAKVDAGKETPDREVAYGQADMTSYAPIAQKHLAEGKMTVMELSAAAIEYSDNTAANLLYKIVGGPKGLTQFARKYGDKTSHFDRNEPTLNTNMPGDKRDTTTPRAMMRLMKVLLTDNVLSPTAKDQLNGWLVGNTTGNTRLRAGVDTLWKVGDKTGTGDNGATNDVAIVWPTGSKPYLIVAYYSNPKNALPKNERALAAIGAMVCDAFKRGN